MSNFSSEALKNGIIPENIATYSEDELKAFIDTLDPDMMGFDGDESPENLSDYADDTVASLSPATVENIGGGLSIIDNLTTINLSNRYNPKKYLVIHYTAGKTDNGTAAKANTNYFKTGYRSASAHLFVDRNPIVYRCVPEDLVAWHCGTSGTYYHSYCRNSNSIGIEVCSYMENGIYKFYDETIKNAIALSRYIVKKYNIPKENVIMHWHVTHKVCAAPFMSNSKPTVLWDNFKNAIYDGNDIDINNYTVKPFISLGRVINISSNDYLNFRSGPGTNYDIIGKFKNGDTFDITGECNDWYQITTTTQKGFVSKSYVELYHWCDSIRDELLNRKIITDKSQWSNYDGVVTKGLAVELISNIYGNKPNDKLEHWADNAVRNLINHKVITDVSQWKDLDTPISKALVLSLIDKSTGGIKELYIGRNADHWSRNNLDSLCDKGIVSFPEQWTDFEAQVQNSLMLSIIYKSLNRIK